jgi:CheY-like chemotaxis protein
MTLVQSSDIRKPFGAAVKSWRSRLGISQEELAGRAGLHRTYICDIERGARNVSLESIRKLARALEISTSTLFAYDGSRAEGMVDILFVEDNPRDAQLAMDALKGLSNMVQLARDGQSALDFLFCEGEFAKRQPGQRPQLILLDLGLPKINGLEVLRRVKADTRTSMIPVVVLTGSSYDRDIQASKRLGAAAYIVKPVAPRNLIDVVPLLRFHWALVKPARALMT